MAEVIERDLGWGRIVQELLLAQGSYTKVGFPVDAAPGAPRKKVIKGRKIASDMSEIAQIAAFNEWGTGVTSGRSGGTIMYIPPRPFMSTSIDENRVQLNELIDKLYFQIIAGNMTTRRALQIIGEWMTTKTKKKIRDIKDPPNAPETIRRKRSSNPLIDTAQMINSVTHVEVIK